VSVLTETDFRAQVVQLATLCGWRSYFVEQSTREIVRRSGARVRVRNVNPAGVGFPDLVLVRARDARLIFAELKRDLGPRGGGEDQHVNPTTEQRAWLDDLTAVAAFIGKATARIGLPIVDVKVWRPRDMPEIERLLR
jgi:hypothetical protein